VDNEEDLVFTRPKK